MRNQVLTQDAKNFSPSSLFIFEWTFLPIEKSSRSNDVKKSSIIIIMCLLMIHPSGVDDEPAALSRRWISESHGDEVALVVLASWWR